MMVDVPPVIMGCRCSCSAGRPFPGVDLKAGFERFCEHKTWHSWAKWTNSYHSVGDGYVYIYIYQNHIYIYIIIHIYIYFIIIYIYM